MVVSVSKKTKKRAMTGIPEGIPVDQNGIVGLFVNFTKA